MATWTPYYNTPTMQAQLTKREVRAGNYVYKPDGTITYAPINTNTQKPYLTQAQLTEVQAKAQQEALNRLGMKPADQSEPEPVPVFSEQGTGVDYLKGYVS